MNYHKIDGCNMLNGDGLRVVIWVSSCDRKCEGCFNPETHDPNSGILFDTEAEKELFEALDKDYIDGITFLGGEPLHNNNIKEIYRLVSKIKELYPNKTIWMYTGYTWEEIQKDNLRKNIVKLVDILCDGPFILSLKEDGIKWVGSSNQRVIDIKKSLKENKIILHCE